MRRAAPFGALLIVLAAPMVSPAHAQYRPPERPAEPVPPEARPGPSPATEAPSPRATTDAAHTVRQLGWRWEPGFVLDGGWEQNVGFMRPPGPDDVFGALRLSIARVRRSQRSDFRVSLAGTGYLYREATNWNRADGFARIAAQGPLSRRVDGRLDGRYDFAHTDSDGILMTGGVLLPLDRTRTAGTGGGLTWRAAEATSLSLDATVQRTEFESERYLDTTTGMGSVSLSRRVSLRDELSLAGTVRRTEDEQSVRQGPTLLAGYGHRFGESLRLRLSLGAGREETVASASAQPPAPRWDLSAEATLEGRIRRSTVTFRYLHGLQPTIGLGVSQVSDTFNLGLNVPVGRRLELVASGTFWTRNNPSSPDLPSLQDWDAYLGASVRMARRLRLVLGYRFRVREDSVGKVNNDRATVSFAYEGSG